MARTWFVSLIFPIALAELTAAETTPWPQPHRYRAVVEVEAAGGAMRSNAPAQVNIDFNKALAESGGKLDDSSVAVYAVNDPTDRVPHRVERYFGIGLVTLHFVVPTSEDRRFLVYFDNTNALAGPSPLYPGLVGDGDRFVEEFQRRNIAPSHFDQLVDFDNDGDLDLFQGGVEPYVQCYENVGGGRLAPRGRLTSGGQPLRLPCSEANRSWLTVAFHDMDADGDQDFFPSFNDGPDRGRFICYRNTTKEQGGVLTFERVGPLETESGEAIPGAHQAGGWFPSLTWVRDWDGSDGSLDALIGSNNRCWLYRGRGVNGKPRLAAPVALRAAGREIELSNPRFAVADVDDDGDFDLLAGTQPGAVYWFKNIGSRNEPLLTNGMIVAWTGRYLIADAHSGVHLTDWTGDGLLDIVSGRFWERADLIRPTAPRTYGGCFVNDGTQPTPQFLLNSQLGPFTMQFQICDAVRQNSLRVADLNSDGRMDLIAGDTDGFVWFFRNKTDSTFPVFAPGEKLQAGEAPLNVTASGGHARLAIIDWTGDGRIDLIVADGSGGLHLFPGGEAKPGHTPTFAPAEALPSTGGPIRIGGRASVMACDWNNDGKIDLVLADEKGYYVCRNSGAVPPLLEQPKAILFGGRPVRYVRPNLGAFVDWDGDGKKDLIGANFENDLRFYRNLGSGEPGVEPSFADPEGEVILRGESPQMISGADVVDWNGDGDLDILTGQGHGASGLRFFERDWLEDKKGRGHPQAAVLAIESKETP